MAAARPLTRRPLLVVGGGPAGFAAAITGAQLGLRVTLVEQAEFPRHRPGETLHPGVEPILAQLGVASTVHNAGFVRHPGIRLRFGGTDRVERYGRDHTGPWLGYQVRRDRFDAILGDHARNLGVSVLQPCQARAVSLAHGRIETVTTTEGVLEPAFVVDASGSRAWLARALGHVVRRDSPRLLAQYGYARGTSTSVHDLPAFGPCGAGWLWLARVSAICYAWVRLIPPGEILDRTWRPPAFSDLDAVGPTRVTDVSWRLVAPVALANYVRVGDAAARLDPASSHGVLRALMSGRYAARLIADVLSRSRSASDLVRVYGRWLEAWYRHDLAQLTQFYAAYRWFRVPAP